MDNLDFDISIEEIYGMTQYEIMQEMIEEYEALEKNK